MSDESDNAPDLHAGIRMVLDGVATIDYATGSEFPDTCDGGDLSVATICRMFSRDPHTCDQQHNI